MTDPRLADRLLPDVSAPWMRDTFEAMIEAWPLDHAALARQSDPLTCDAKLLPHLFFDGGGLFWLDAWPEAKKRFVVDNLFTFKRLEGTPAGVEAYLNLVDTFLMQEELPPGSAFLVPGDTLDHQGVLDLMPQLRLYHDHPPRFEPDDTAFWALSFWGVQYWTPETASPLARYPVLYGGGGETPLQASDLSIDDLTARLARPGEAGAGAFWHDAVWGGASYFGDVVAYDSIVFALADPQLERVRDAGDARFEEGWWRFGYQHVQHWTPDDLSGVYDRLYLWEPDRIPRGASAYASGAFWGAFRFGVQPYHSYLAVGVPSAMPALPGPWLFWGHGFRVPHDHGPVAEAMLAADAGRRVGDRILVQLHPTAAGGVMPPLPVLDADPLPDLSEPA